MERRRGPYADFLASLPAGAKLLGFSVPPIMPQTKEGRS